MSPYWYKKQFNQPMRKKRKLFLTIKFQLINREEKMELGKKSLTNGTLIFVSGKNHQWMLKLICERMIKNDIYKASKYDAY